MAATEAAATPVRPHTSSPSKSDGSAPAPTSISINSEQHKRIEKHLQSNLAALQKREPLDLTYEPLLPVSFRKHAKAAASVNKSAVGGSDGGNKSPSSKKSNALSADVKLRRRLNANLRSAVEIYVSTPAGWRRRPNTRRVDLDFGGSQSRSADGVADADDAEIRAKLRAAFALRESKEHEQRDLVNATLKAENAKLRRGWGFTPATGAGGAGSAIGGVARAAPPAGILPPLETAAVRKKRLDGIAKQLKEKEKGAADRIAWTKIAWRGRSLILNPESTAKAILAEPLTKPEPVPPPAPAPDASGASKPEEAPEAKRRRVEEQRKERERQRKIEEARKREKELQERLAREEAEQKRAIEKERREQERRERVVETPRDALHRLYEPIFTALWDMEFPGLGNPFRMVIDASNCAEMGLPDYCNIVKKPMNLTFVQAKVNNKSYESLQEFMEDVDLIVKNAMQYNYQSDNPYHLAAKSLRKKFRKLAKPLIQSLTKGLAPK